MGAGGSHGPCGCPAPTRRARRAHNRAWAAWALASGRPPHREERAEGCSERPRACAPCPARDPRVRGRHPRPSCSARPLAACTSGACSGSGAPRGVRVRRTARRGAARPPRRRSTCAPGHGEGLYVLPRPAQSRPARSARAWWACSGLPLGPRGWYPADSSAPPGVVGAEALRRAWVTLLRAWGISVGYQGGWKARIPFRRPPPDLPLQDPVLEGGCAVLGLTARYVAS